MWAWTRGCAIACCYPLRLTVRHSFPLVISPLSTDFKMLPDNLDYNLLKQLIKMQTTRDQTAAIAIPGSRDTGLLAFELQFYDELCRQHDAVEMFVSSKTDEITRRLSMQPTCHTLYSS